MEPGSITRKRGFPIQRALVGVAVIAWCLATGYAFHVAMKWESSPGAAATKPRSPDIHEGKVAVIVVAHTRCPCTAASIRNLMSLPQAVRKNIAIKIVFSGPGANPGSKAENILLAEQLKDEQIEYTTEAEAVNRYGARTSGQTFIYNAAGKLVFSGGITDARGTAGDSIGLKAIEAVSRGQSCPPGAPVYGCALQTPKESS